MQGMAGRDPEFHIRPLLFQMTSLPCPAIHCSDDEDYSGSGSDNEQSHHHDEKNYNDDIDYHDQNHGEDGHDRDYSTPAVSDNQPSFPWLEAKGGQKEIEEV